MRLTEKEKLFIQGHINDDTVKLLLSASCYPDIDIPFMVDQIASRRQVANKLPSLVNNYSLLFPAKIASEQCSSEQTAEYKAKLVSNDSIVCDMTGGLGIDAYSFSKQTFRVVYIERFPLYCEVAKYNFKILNAENIDVINADSTTYIDEIENVDVIYLDPARRKAGNKRAFALSDCEPDLTQLLPLLRKKAKHIIAKLSPMADITKTIELLPGIFSIHVLSVRNECKEMVVEIGDSFVDDPIIHCVNFLSSSSGAAQTFSFTQEQECDALIKNFSGIKRYLYEPNASILKAGAFKSVASQFEIEKLHTSSHLYTSDSLVESFPGRSFLVENIIPFTNKICNRLSASIPKANITVRNFPLSVDELRKKSRIKEGGDIYIFATTLSQGEKVLLCCRKT